MNLQYNSTVINLAKHMHELACVEEISYDHPTYGKKLSGLQADMVALSIQYSKSFEQVYEDVSDYAGWMSVQHCMDEIGTLPLDSVAISS